MTTPSERPLPATAPPEPARAAPGPVPSPLPFTLLMSVYAGDRCDFVSRAFHSSVTEQQRPPAEVVLVQDGPVPDDLLACLDALCAQSPVPAVRVVLPGERRARTRA